MGVLQRMKDILSANINELLDKAEDPEKMAEQYLREYREDLAEVKQDTAEVMATAKRAERDLNQAKQDAERYRNAARSALAAGSEADARTLLARAQDADARAAQWQVEYDSAKRDSYNMLAMYQKLTDDIRSLEYRRDKIASQSARANAQAKLNETAQTANRMSGVADAFARMEEKAQRQLDEATAQAELDATLSADEDLVKKYSGGSDASVEEELARIRKEMEGLK